MSYYPTRPGIDINHLAQSLVNELGARDRNRDPLVMETMPDFDYNDFRNPDFEQLLSTTESYLEFLLSERRHPDEAMHKAINFGIDLTTSSMIAKRRIQMPPDVERRMGEVFRFAEETKRQQQQSQQSQYSGGYDNYRSAPPPPPSYGGGSPGYGQPQPGYGYQQQPQYQQPGYNTPPPQSAPAQTDSPNGTVRKIHRDADGNVVTKSPYEETTPQHTAPEIAPRIIRREPDVQASEPEKDYAKRIGDNMDYEDHKQLAMKSMQLSETKAARMAKFMGDLESQSRYSVNGGIRSRNQKDEPQDDKDMAEHITFDDTIHAFGIHDATTQLRAHLPEAKDTQALSFNYLSTTTLMEFDDVSTARLAVANAELEKQISELNTVEDFVNWYLQDTTSPVAGKIKRYMNHKLTHVVNRYIAYVLDDPASWVDSVGDDYKDLCTWFDENASGLAGISEALVNKAKATIVLSDSDDDDVEEEAFYTDRCVLAGVTHSVLRLDATPEVYHLAHPSGRVIISNQHHPELCGLLDAHMQQSRKSKVSVFTHYVIFEDMIVAEVYPIGESGEYRLVPV